METRIHFTHSKNEVDIYSNKRVAMLMEESGVGKTYVAKRLLEAADAAKYGDFQATLNGESCPVEVVTDSDSEEEVYRKVQCEGHIVMVDEADAIFDQYDEIPGIIYDNEKSAFIVVARQTWTGLPIALNQYLELKYAKEKNRAKIEIVPYKKEFTL